MLGHDAMSPSSRTNNSHDYRLEDGFMGSSGICLDPDDWSSISDDDVDALVCDTLYTSTLSSSCASETNAVEMQSEASLETSSRESDGKGELLNIADIVDQSDKDVCRSVASSPIDVAKDRSFVTRIQRHLRACLEIVAKFVSQGVHSVKNASARIQAHLRAINALDYKRLALPASVGVSIAVLYLVFDNARLRKELRCSCSDEKINRLIISGLRMKAALTNVTDCAAGFRSSTLFL